MTGYWLKLYTEILEDPKYYRLSDSAKLGMYELFLLAKKNLADDGFLPDIEDIAFYTRRNSDWWINVIDELVKCGIVVKDDDRLCVRNFKKRQAPVDGPERARQSRTIKNKSAYESHGIVYESHGETETETETETEEKKIEKSSPPASSPQFFDPGWHERVFIQVTQIPGIPGSDLPKVYEALEAMRTRFKTEADMVGYLRPYFENWINRKTRDGRKYSRSNCAWLYDTALAGDPLPSAYKPPGEKPDPNCPKCKGIGFLASNVKYGDAEFGKLVKCSCMRVREEVPV